MINIDKEVVNRIVSVTLRHVVQEFPHSQTRVFTSPEDFVRPSVVHPIFYGSYDWHSCVHGCWLLVKALDNPIDEKLVIEIVDLLDKKFTLQNALTEREFFARPDQGGFERPYGWAWLLALAADLKRSGHPRALTWFDNLAPLSQLIAEKLATYLPKLMTPIRSGVHNNTAFALLLALEYCEAVNDTRLGALLIERAKTYYLKALPSPKNEPGGEDFLSPTWQQFLLLQKVLSETEFEYWLVSAISSFDSHEWMSLLTPVSTVDRSDGRLAHWDGLNLSRAWCMAQVAKSLPEESVYKKQLNSAADAHLSAGRDHLHDHYMGEHWLATFLLLALSK